MKIRNGFVSNSSSSSFIIFLDPSFELSVENIKKTMFGDNVSSVPYHYNWGNENAQLDTDVLTRWVFDEFTRAFENQKSAEYEGIVNELGSELETDLYWDKYESLPRPKNYQDQDEMKKYHDAMNKMHREIEEEGIKLAKELLESKKGLIPVVIGFGDGDGQYGSHLEHSGIIEKMFGAIRISHH